MKRNANGWEYRISSIIPYMKWSEPKDCNGDEWKSGRHNHSAYELHIILSGECRLSVDNTELALKSGEAILIPPEVFHSADSLSKPISRLSLSFSLNEAAPKDLLPIEKPFLLFTPDEPTKAVCDLIVSEINDKGKPFYEETLSGEFALLALYVLRALKSCDSTSAKERLHASETEDITVIDGFFVNTPPRQRSKENLAKLLHCSERQVLRKIRAHYGMSFQKKLALSRIDTAAHLLRVSEKSVEVISDLVGYADKAAFYKAFRQHTGITPIKYRKSFKHGGYYEAEM